MKAIVIPAPNQIEIRDVPMPEVKAGEALLKVKYVGICGVDVDSESPCVMDRLVLVPTEPDEPTPEPPQELIFEFDTLTYTPMPHWHEIPYTHGALPDGVTDQRTANMSLNLGEEVSVTLTVEKAGTYALVLHAVTNTNGPILQFAVNGQNVGGKVKMAYGGQWGYATFNLGYVTLNAGENTLSFRSVDVASDASFMLDNLEKAGQEVDPSYSLAWFTNVPMVQSDVPYYAHASKDYAYTWHVPTKCADVELALRYLNWMYSEEGSEILSWGKKGESYGVDEAGNKYFLEGYDATYQARYSEAGYIDFKATATTYTGKCQEFIFDVNEAAKAGGFYYPPVVVLNEEEQSVVNTYAVDFELVKDSYWFNFLLGQKDIESDADWNEFKSACAADTTISLSNP